MDLLTKILINKYKNQGEGSGGSTMNLFIQIDQPEGYNGIWIKSNTYSYENIVETDEQTTASSINFIRGNKRSTIMYRGIENGLTYSFNEVLLTNAQNEVMYNEPEIYYGNGLSWIDITPTPLPYVPVEFIQGTGTQWINTGLQINNGYEIEMEYKIPERGTTGSYQYIYGCKNPSGTSYATYCRFDRGDEELEFNDGAGGTVSSGWGSISGKYDTMLKIYMQFNPSHIKVMFNDTVLKDANINYTLPSTPLGLFILAPNVENYGKYKLYSCKIKNNNGELIADYIPCVRKSDEEVCLYDNVSKTFFTNAGTGDFIAGPEV